MLANIVAFGPTRLSHLLSELDGCSCLSMLKYLYFSCLHMALPIIEWYIWILLGRSIRTYFVDNFWMCLEDLNPDLFIWPKSYIHYWPKGSGFFQWYMLLCYSWYQLFLRLHYILLAWAFDRDTFHKFQWSYQLSLSGLLCKIVVCFRTCDKHQYEFALNY